MLANSYGVTSQYSCDGELAEQQELFLRQGYALLDSKISDKTINKIKSAIQSIKEEYYFLAGMSEKELGIAGEQHTIRCPLLFDPIFLEVCLNHELLKFIRIIMGGGQFHS